MFLAGLQEFGEVRLDQVRILWKFALAGVLLFSLVQPLKLW